MKKIGQIGLLLVLLLSGCALPRASSLLQMATPTVSSTGSSTVPALSALPTLSATPSQTLPPAASETPSGTETPWPTSTSIPLPLTPVPTFDQKNAHPIPLSSPAICPKADPSIALKDFYDVEKKEMKESDALAYINAGGNLDAFANLNIYGQPQKIIDLTGDGAPEIIYNTSGFGMDIYGCKDGQYESMASLLAYTAHVIRLEDVRDLNKNGLPELILFNDGAIKIYEWNGVIFRQMVSSVYITGNYQIVDLNGDGLFEILSFDNDRSVPIHKPELPVWEMTIVVGWDGLHYVEILPRKYEKLKFRFQAVETGDDETLLGHYPEALAFYHDVIFDNSMTWWTNERVYYENNHAYDDPSVPTPVPDNTEYDKLAAYAYYRSMILHVHLLQTDLAQAEYSTLQTKFQPASPGYPYVEMATAFWENYLTSGRMYSACQAAIQYAKDNPDILNPLGYNGVEGWTGRTYLPGDICPFAAPAQ